MTNSKANNGTAQPSAGTVAKAKSQPQRRQASSASRHNARRLVVQALYQRSIAGHSLTELLAQYEQDAQRADKDFLNAALTACINDEMGLQLQLEPLLDRDEEQLGVIERAVLLLAAYELTQRLDVPYKVVINEGISLAKEFGAESSWRFVNAVLDKLAAEVRSLEKHAAKS